MVASRGVAAVVMTYSLVEAGSDIVILVVAEGAVSDHRGFALYGLGMDRGLSLLTRGHHLVL